LSYIIDLDSQERESYAIKQIMRALVLVDHLAPALGLDDFSWYVLEVDTQWTGRKPGDVDILAGHLTWTNPDDIRAAVAHWAAVRPAAHPDVQTMLAAKQVAEQGGIAWPPSTDYLVGIEVKCAYYNSRNVIERVDAEKQDRVPPGDLLDCADLRSCHCTIIVASNPLDSLHALSDLIRRSNACRVGTVARYLH
jgi:hypothetical protein